MTRVGFLLLAAGLAAGPALAESHMDTQILIRTRDITGGDIYTRKTHEQLEEMESVAEGWLN